jgi:hypothetical protein
MTSQAAYVTGVYSTLEESSLGFLVKDVASDQFGSFGYIARNFVVYKYHLVFEGHRNLETCDGLDM